MHFRPLIAFSSAFPLLALGGCMFSSLLANETKAVGPVVSHEEAASRFDKIEVHGPFQVQFTVGASTPVKIEAQKEIVDATR